MNSFQWHWDNQARINGAKRQDISIIHYDQYGRILPSKLDSAKVELAAHCKREKYITEMLALAYEGYEF